jgi:hypothetical protein
MIINYALKTIEQMKMHYSRLSKKEGRRYAALEALRLGPGGVENVSSILGIRQSTIKKVIKEMAKESETPSVLGSRKQRTSVRKKNT